MQPSLRLSNQCQPLCQCPLCTPPAVKEHGRRLVGVVGTPHREPQPPGTLGFAARSTVAAQLLLKPCVPRLHARQVDVCTYCAVCTGPAKPPISGQRQRTVMEPWLVFPQALLRRRPPERLQRGPWGSASSRCVCNNTAPRLSLGALLGAHHAVDPVPFAPPSCVRRRHKRDEAPSQPTGPPAKARRLQPYGAGVSSSRGGTTTPPATLAPRWLTAAARPCRWLPIQPPACSYPRHPASCTPKASKDSSSLFRSPNNALHPLPPLDPSCRSGRCWVPATARFGARATLRIRHSSSTVQSFNRLVGHAPQLAISLKCGILELGEISDDPRLPRFQSVR